MSSSYRNRPKQEFATSRYRRLRYFLSRVFGTRLQKSQHLRFVTFNGRRYKRIILRDSFLAAQIESHFLRFGPSEHVPPFVIRYEHEIWVEYVDGEPLVGADAAAARDLAVFYARVSARRSQQMALADTPFHDALQLDLRFLHQVGVLDDTASRDLSLAAERRKPAAVWVGFDYNDPVLKNFVRRADSGAICAVDVESLVDQQLIGSGVAKALLRWMDPHRNAFFETYRDASGVDVLPYFDYVELCFIASYTKLMFLERKWKHVDPSIFDRFRGDSRQAGQ